MARFNSNKTASSSDQVYWANKPRKDAVEQAVKYIDDYYQYLSSGSNGHPSRASLWKKSYDYYNAATNRNGGSIRKGGQDSQYTVVEVNDYRNFLAHLQTLLFDQRLTFEPRSTNTDYKSQVQTLLGKNILDYYMREAHLEKKFKQVGECALLYAEGFLEAVWDPHAGEQDSTDPDTGEEIRKGDVVCLKHAPINVIRDVNIDDPEKVQWYIVRKLVNKYDLAARYPEHASDIVAMNATHNQFEYVRPGTYGLNANSDQVYLFTLYHDKTPAIPAGREIEFIDHDTILNDQPLPYKKLPVYRMSAGEIDGTIFGYSVGFDLLAINEALNALYSVVLSNQEAFGVQNIMVLKGTGFNPSTQGAGGMNVFEYDDPQGKPEALNLLHTPAEIFNFIKQLEGKQRDLSGISSVIQGNVDPKMSGAALALLQSMAVQFSQALQQSYVAMVEQVGTAIINMLKEKAAVKRTASIVGASNRVYLREFVGKDLESVDRVLVDIGNPLTRTTAGKLQIAQDLLQAKQIATPQQYIQVIQTGNLETLTEGTMKELTNIKAENEQMADGQPPQIAVTDDHKLHIQEHACVLADPYARQDPELIKTVDAHIQEHLAMLTDPRHTMLHTILQHMPQEVAQQNMIQQQQQAQQVVQGAGQQSANEMAATGEPNLPSMPKALVAGQSMPPNPNKVEAPV